MNLLLYKIKQLYNSSIIGITWPLVLLISYTLLGAVIFRNLELEIDQKQRLLFREKTEYAFSEVVNRLLKIKCPNNIPSTYEDSSNIVNTTYQTFQIRDSILFFVDHLNLTDIIEDRMGPSPWTIMGSMFYAGQLYTTIGYGNPVAKTNYGKLASIIYIMIGIPLFLIILKKIGKIMSETLTKIYQHYMYARRQLPSAKKNLIRKASMKLAKKSDVISTISDKIDSINSETLIENDENIEIEEVEDFPIFLALLIMILWIALSAALFCIWETEWPYLTSVYFFFVSISTVGLGDIVPSKFDMIFVNFLLILIGLALLSMCINLIQTAIEKLLNDLLDEYINEIEKIGEKQNKNNDKIIFKDDESDFHIRNDKKQHGGLRTTYWISRIFKTWIEQSLIKEIGFIEDDDNSEFRERLERTPTPTTKFNHHTMVPKTSLKRKLSNLRKTNNMSYFLRSTLLNKILTPDHFEPLEDVKNRKDSKLVTSSSQTETSSNVTMLYGNGYVNTDKNDILSIYSSPCEGSLISVAYNDVNYGYSNETLTNMYKNQQDNATINSIEDTRSCYSMSYATTPLSYRKMLNGEIINTNTGMQISNEEDNTLKKKLSLVQYTKKK
ncbi:Potassium channel subfamily K member 18 [Strongyloides ratti]|uniref:Potassium channel subfamily K member 18 n=1 Tax=Strongyloides ratti TaxID=34506 RepID=A0A090L0P5_STRRB|nr:Potassium channel subfamily K member 18 [Strongyloides ratti]CEF63350.1 Potassium channel subfamily K member 18 [Strongyloides ratti]